MFFFLSPHALKNVLGDTHSLGKCYSENTYQGLQTEMILEFNDISMTYLRKLDNICCLDTKENEFHSNCAILDLICVAI